MSIETACTAGGGRSPSVANFAGNALKQILIQKLQQLIKMNL